MKHKSKLHLARKMRSNEEIKKKTPPFLSKFWLNRSESQKKKKNNKSKSL